MDYIIRTPDQLKPVLQSFRRSRKLSQEAIAGRLGVTQQTLSELERNASRATLERLMRLLGALDLELVIRDRGSNARSRDASAPEF